MSCTLKLGLTGSRNATVRSTRSRRAVCVRALFGGGRKNEQQEEKDEQFRIQQELLEKRKSGSLIREANDRRRKVQETLRGKKEERQREKDALSEGVIPDALKKWKPYDNKLDEEANSGIIVPLLPLGIQKYDEGERFDLRSPYADDGWVDPDEADDPWAGLKNLFSFGKKPVSDKPKDKKVVWASQYGKYAAEKKQAKEGGK